MTARKPKSHLAYQKLRRENPRQYHSPTNQQAMLQDRMELGHDAFYSTDQANKDDDLTTKLTKMLTEHLKETSQ